ncbi:disintegrin and metalloproteinase domain-containing protein 10 [Nilaparvata lugens]|uniref:disintegrin and metalloproteinase domain-containing protein 10 n=1 Tax=Nilaparvata lugens TaxID=108931 RepID=UPI00193E86CF|nr:disintegrin and metalloproteinase domain-containing protein 10 [Nilaparvata lugens]
MFGAIGNIAFFILLVPYIESANRLNEYIAHYEAASYARADVVRAHQRAKRSVTRDPSLHLRFEAHGRAFNIRLKRDLTVFSDALSVVDSRETHLPVDTSHVYHGHLLGEPGSVVFGSILDGVFEGKIISPEGGGAYYVEKASRYFPPHHTNDSFHSIIYMDKDVQDPYAGIRHGHGSGCGITDSVSQWMDKIQNSAVEEELEEEDDDNKLNKNSNKINSNTNTSDSSRHSNLGEDEDDKLILSRKTKSKLPKKVVNGGGGKKEKERKKAGGDGGDWRRNERETPFDKYSREANTRPYYEDGYASRSKRAARPKEDNRNTCSLFIQTDPLIWRHISAQVNDDPEKTREEILSLIAHHVTAVNYIYRDTKFDGRIEHRNIKFEVQRIKIDDETACQGGGGDSPSPFCFENIDVSNFLNLHSLGNHEAFCLAYVFTYRDFTGGTLGLAWVASASGASGGICEKFKTYTETIGGLYQSTKRSLNTGIITFVNYNSRVPPKVSQLTLAHEIGHNFGSPHDYPLACRPGGTPGNYIMFASATSGDRPNNSKFSSCSIGNISNVLDAIEDNKKRNCFKSSEGAFCGNKIVEAGEECDCGYDDDECLDECCYPRVISEQEHMKNQSARGCHRRANTQCSPSQGPCCANNCRFIADYHQMRCKSESECSWSSMCDGRSSECPAPAPKANKTRCNEGTQLCINGDCTGSICLEWGLPEGGISLRPGSPCDNFQGYCDVFFKCRAVDAEGPLARLKNTLFNKETLLTVTQWVTEYWWACLLMGIAFIIVMGIFIKCCAVHTPSSNPKKPPARRFSETLRHPMHTLRRMRSSGGGGGGGGGGRMPMGGGSTRPGPSRPGPAHGYGEGRGQYYVPKATAPPANRPDLYAGAYTDRNAFHMRQHKV